MIQKRIAQGDNFTGLIVPTSESPIAEYELVLEAGAKADLVVIVLPGTDAKGRFRISLEGSGADCNLSGIYLCPESENVNLDIEVVHKVSGCTSRQMFKGIVAGESKVDFYGKIIVAQDAQKTEAYQENHSLLLSDGARVNTKPQLEIYADDVKCTHGATIGKLNENEQFYMRSRGISLEEAKVLQMISFISPVFDHIADEGKRQEVTAEVERLLRERF